MLKSSASYALNTSKVLNLSIESKYKNLKCKVPPPPELQHGAFTPPPKFGSTLKI